MESFHGSINILKVIYKYIIYNIMKYCFRCGNSFTTKSNLNKHLRKKKPCEIIYLDILRDDVIKRYKEYIKDFISVYKIKMDSIANNLPIKTNTTANNLPIKTNTTANNLPIISNTMDSENLGTNSETESAISGKLCEYCGKKFSHRNSYYLHKKKYCKVIKNNIEKEELMDEFLNTKYSLLKLEYEEKLEEKLEEERIKNVATKEILENKIKELESKLIPTASQINNGHIGDNINNNIANITINNFGEEKFNMTVQDCEKIMSYEFDMIVKLIEHIHIIPPENRNAFIPSLKEKYAMILKDQKWDLVDRKEFIDNLVISKNVMLEKMLDEYGSQFENVNPNRSRSVINYCKNDEEEYKRIKTNANLLLFNNKDMIRDTYEIKYNKKIQPR